MHRFTQLLATAVAAATSVSAADPIVTSLLLPYNDPQPFVATVLNVDGSATTFAYTCASTVEPEYCGMATHGTIVQGPSTWRMTLSQSDDDGLFAITAACALTPSKNAASCTVSETESDSETQGSSTKTGSTTSYSSDLQPVTLISGLDKLTGGAVPSPSTASSTASSSGAASTGSGSSSDSQPQSTGSASQSLTSGAASPSGAASSSASASGSKTGTANAAPAATQPALLVGVAAVVGALAL